MNQSLSKIIAVLVFSLFTISCSTLFSKFKKSDIEGPMASDIVNQDVDKDHQGSDGGDIQGLSTVFFDYDSSTLTEDTKDQLRANAEWIKSRGKISRVELEGHCDSMGSEAYNIGLGLRRSQGVRAFLIEQGIGEEKLSIISYGEERPLSVSDHSRNRRVNFVPIY